MSNQTLCPLCQNREPAPNRSLCNECSASLHLPSSALANGDLIAALEAERDDWKSRCSLLSWLEKLAVITALEAERDDWKARYEKACEMLKPFADFAKQEHIVNDCFGSERIGTFWQGKTDHTMTVGDCRAAAKFLEEAKP